MMYLLQAVAMAAWMVGLFLILGSHFLPETRLLLGGVYLIIGTNAACGAALLWVLRRDP
ncbi:MAG: hypothetical protein ACJ8R9_02480 [Steroidobacteraceae bacterium]